jgi:ribose-phosphate pyrophosphokinase
MINSDVLLLGFPDYAQQAVAIAKAIDAPYCEVKIHYFPDGESRIVLPSTLPKHIILCRSLNLPNKKLIELLMVAGSARKQGIESITLVAPYMCYMRQDIAFHSGEVISQAIIGELLAHYFDNLLTVDAHLHRVHDISLAIPVNHAINVTATKPMAHFIQAHIDRPFLIGPDSESEQWVANIADHYQMEYRIASKERLGDKDVRTVLPIADYKMRHIVIVDDMASTGKTLLAVVKLLAEFSPASISVLVTHALFVDDAITELQRANVTNIWSCDAISHPTNAIPLAELLAEQLQNILVYSR